MKKLVLMLKLKKQLENNILVLPPPKIPSVPARTRRKGGVGGNSAVFLQKIEAKPAALLVESRTPKKSFVFLFRRKKSGAHKSGKVNKTFLWGGERQLAAAGRLP